mgnify:CR=1 FL=1
MCSLHIRRRFRSRRPHETCPPIRAPAACLALRQAARPPTRRSSGVSRHRPPVHRPVSAMLAPGAATPPSDVWAKRHSDAPLSRGGQPMTSCQALRHRESPVPEPLSLHGPADRPQGCIPLHAAHDFNLAFPQPRQRSPHAMGPPTGCLTHLLQARPTPLAPQRNQSRDLAVGTRPVGIGNGGGNGLSFPVP